MGLGLDDAGDAEGRQVFGRGSRCPRPRTPRMTRSATISSTEASVSRWVLSQASVVFIAPAPSPATAARAAGSRNACSQRRSLSKKVRRSGMPYFSMAMRSIPMPKAKPCHASGSRPQLREHLGMHHARAQNFEPVAAGADLEAAAFARTADIDLGGRLGEGEIARPEAHRQMLDVEEGAAEFDEAALQMPHVDGAVDHQPLDLMEHRRVRGVVIAAEGAAGHDDPERRLARAHGADLHRRGVRAQDLAAVCGSRSSR